ncbi:GRIN2-like protein [Halichoeres trimaculatus]|uniref:GRIN2-like protein n=1 Tax=Halichoeres trimaculatus TaxID=147232 RepID=UPI003D9DFBC1
MQTSSQKPCKVLSEASQADRTVQASLPVHRSHSITSPMIQQAAPPQTDHEACGISRQRGNNSIPETDTHSMVLCKQPTELQQSSTVPALSGAGGVPQNRCVCMLSPSTAGSLEGVKEEGNLPATACDVAHCCGSYINHANFEDTFAAYCHPQPIPSPSQLLQPLPGPEPSCDNQRALEPSSALNHLTLPRLISSVSETGLDAKHLLRCCNLSCSWISSLPPAGPQSQKPCALEESYSSSTGLFRAATRDMGTMTASKELRDVGVQTGQNVTPHVFPEICLAEETRSEIPDSTDGDKKAGGAPKSPVKEVKWDAEGMTWEVYGASVDPEELGLAIQRHLELQIKETAKHATKLSRQNTNTSHQSRNNSCQRKRSRMMGSFRTPVCCACTTTAVD